jgi:intracellular multiplication protein IcmL
MIEAIQTSYSFDFVNFDQQIEKAAYYFTPAGYDMFLKSLKENNVKEDLLKNKIQVSLLPLQKPVYINGGNFGNKEFWRYRLPVLVSYYNGNKPVLKKMKIEVLILRVPAYENPKGLAIAEFNMMN